MAVGTELVARARGALRALGVRRAVPVAAVCLVAAALVVWRAWPAHLRSAAEVAAPAAARGDDPLALQRAIERRAERRIVSLVGTVIGRDRIVVRVTATLEPARSERTEESVDPDRAALRSQSTRRQENGVRED